MKDKHLILGLILAWVLCILMFINNTTLRNNRKQLILYCKQSDTLCRVSMGQTDTVIYMLTQTMKELEKVRHERDSVIKKCK